MIVTAYKAGKYSLRISVPKPIYYTFAQISQTLRNNTYAPCLQARISRKTDDGLKPYFSSCNIGLELYLGKRDHTTLISVVPFGKTNRGFTINAKRAARLGIVHGSKLDCQILENTKPSPQCHNKIIGYRLV